MSNKSHARSELEYIGASEELILAMEKGLTFLGDFDSGAHSMGISILKSLRRQFLKDSFLYIHGIPKDAVIYPFAEYLKSLPYATAKTVIEYIPEIFDCKNISPLTGEDNEWFHHHDGMFQNKRCGTVFKDSDRFNGQAYDIDGRVWACPNWAHDDWSYWGTSGGLLKLIEFPYAPKTEYLHYHSEGDKILLEEKFDTKHTARLWNQLLVCGIDPEHNTINNEVVFMTKKRAMEVMDYFHSLVEHKYKLEDRHSFYEDGSSEPNPGLPPTQRLLGLLGYDYQETEDGYYLIRGIKHEFRLAEVLTPNKHYQKWIQLRDNITLDFNKRLKETPLFQYVEKPEPLYAWILEPVIPDYCKKENKKDFLYVDRLTDKIGQLPQYEQSVRCNGIRQNIFVMIGGDTDNYLHEQRRKYGFAHPKRKSARLGNDECGSEAMVCEEPVVDSESSKIVE